MTTATKTDVAPFAKPQRLASIDAYRGFVMFLMMAEVLRLSQVSAKLPESAFWKFLAFHQSHVPWAGCSLHDLIQPSFSFLVGVSLPFSLASRRAKGQSRLVMVAHAVWRAAILVLLGVFLRSMGAKQTNWTFEDTLSQIGFGYVPLFLLGFTKPRWQWAALGMILVGYWAAFAAYPLPPSDFDYQAVGVAADWPYHYHGLAAHWDKNTNLAWAFDTWFLNLFPRKTPFVANTGGYATLSFIPTLGTMILGLIAGAWLRRGAVQQSSSDQQRRTPTHSSGRDVRASAETVGLLAESPWRIVGLLVLTGIVMLALALIAHGTVQIPYMKGMESVSVGPGIICPSVKRIWTPSWTLYSGGWCFLLLAGFYLVIDTAGLASWSFPLRVIGANSIAAYILAHGPDKFIRDSFYVHFGRELFEKFGPAYTPLITGAVILLVEWLILYWLYRQKIHIRI